jgi:DNA-binding response OmpR family regulator
MRRDLGILVFFVNANIKGNDHAGKERILFVDDEKSLVNLVSQMLKRLGYRVEATTTPSDAFEIFNANPDKFDLVITDLIMSGMSGDKLAKEILAIRPKMPIILCSGFIDKMDGVKAKESGIRAFIKKPFAIRELANRIRTVLDQD